MPPQLIGYGLLWGTPEQVAAKLRAFGAVGLRHVVLDVASAVTSRRMALYGLLAVRRIALLLRTDP